jgi:group II intron reverse transcriptase/maturase
MGETAMLFTIAAMQNLYAAFDRVALSRGMAGVDGITIGGFKKELGTNLEALARELTQESYAPLPLLRILVAKPDGSPRALSVPTVRDRVAQAAVLNVIGPLFEAEFESCSFAYRKGRSVKSAAWRIKELREKGYSHVVSVDIDSFFDNIDHDLLMRKAADVISDAALLRLIRLWVEAEIYDGEKLFVLEKGICQGSVISPMLANLFLDELDETLLHHGYQLVRYSDDFIILVRTASEARKALELTEHVLSNLHLTLDAEDTEVTDFSKGFKYLGLIFLGDSILSPFDRPPREKRVLYMPPPFSMEAYLNGKRA